MFIATDSKTRIKLRRSGMFIIHYMPLLRSLILLIVR